MNGKIVLVVKDLGHVPSFKNSKMLTRGRLITKPERQKWMARCIQSFLAQLSCSSQTIAVEMRAARSTPYLTAWSPRFDDSVQWIPDIKITTQIVAKGKEGAIVILEKL